jgi:thioredoxin-related protein
MNSTRFSHGLLFWLLLASPLIAGEMDLLPQAKNLQRLGASAAGRNIPILLMVSQSHCEFCERMKLEVLNPMQLSGEYADRIVMRELLIDEGESVINFAGRRETTKLFSSHYHIQVTPTLLFLDGKGNEVADRILGINTVDYLPFYVDEAITSASKSLRR